jgi:hypothetical protein
MMIELTTHDAGVLSRLVQFYGLPIEERQKILNEIQSPDARQVGEAVLDPTKLSAFSEPVQATVNRVQQWLENNKRLGHRRRRASRYK